MIKSFIRNIRRQPKWKRDNIAFGIAGTFTAVIFVVWLYHMPARISAISNKSSDDKSSASFSQLFSEVKSQASTIKASVSGNTDVKNNNDVIEAENNFSSDTNSSSETTNSSSTSQVVASSSLQLSSSTLREARIATTSSSSSVSNTEADNQ